MIIDRWNACGRRTDQQWRKKGMMRNNNDNNDNNNKNKKNEKKKKKSQLPITIQFVSNDEK